MKGHLINLSTEERHELGPVSILGRSAECQIVVRDPRVSRRHAMIRRQEDGFWIFDLGSFNGSYLNGSRITTARRLNHGEEMDLAGNHWRFEQEGDAFSREDDSLGGSTLALIRSHPVIILVSDIEGFTRLSEHMPPDELAQVIGAWYASCETILALHGATVDKFIGDSVLAYWTKTDPKSRLAALCAARDLSKACASIKEQHETTFQNAGIESFRSGLALHSGKAAYGGMSATERTLIGDAVNLTFRLESLTRELQQPALASGDFIRDWPEGQAFCAPLGVHKVKGRAQPVDVWAITSYPAG
ncbi:MAG: adenylate/guanylate cyclase domain-containing protein [Verrucomicrobiales bacterium]|nr:FHA domain-containing protein [Verrucomicrobiales bacterium]